MLPTDLSRYTSIESVDLAPDGRSVVVASSRIDLDANRYHRQLSLAGETGKPLTYGPADKQPRFSPDGRAVAFLREIDGVDQLAVIDVDGGEARLLTDFDHEVLAFDWAPDSSRLVAQVRESLDESDPTDLERSVRFRRITRYPYRFDEPRWEGDTVDHLWVVAPDGAPMRLTSGQAGCEAPHWSPDGTEIAFISDQSGRRFRTMSQHVCTVPADGGEVSLRSGLGFFTDVGYRPDGVIHVVGLDHELDWPAPLRLWRLEDAGLIDVAPALDRTITLVKVPLRWDGNDAVVVLDDRGKNVVVGIGPDGAISPLLDERVGVRSVSIVDGRLAVAAHSTIDPGYVVVGDAVGFETWAQPNLDSGVEFLPGEYFQVAANGVEIDAWVYLPPGTDSMPLLLNIHGGPAGQYGFGFLDEFQVYARAGYGVVACNPRGSSGRGAAWLKAVTGEGWGVNDMADVQAVVAAAAERYPRLDQTRKGIMGGSYGGFLTAWITAHDQSFSSAVVERALLNWTSFTGTSDIAGSFPGMYVNGATMPGGFDALWQASPIRLADQITTPTLVVHSEGDYRCPVEQAEQLFFILLKNGIRSEFLRFAGESHELSRSGQPHNRLHRFEAVLDWHGRHL